MYYKITNTESEVYKKMASLLAKEKEINESNKKALVEKIPYKWDKFLGIQDNKPMVVPMNIADSFFLNLKK